MTKKIVLPIILVTGLCWLSVNEFNHWHMLRGQHLTAVDEWPRQVVSVPRGQQRQVILPDSTRVWLNAATTLQYPTDMAAGERVVDVTGEALFEVVKNTAHPFRVRTQNFQAEVLGTRFDIRAYPYENIARAAVAEGAVKVTRGDEAAVLKTHEEVTIDPYNANGPALQVIHNANVAAATDWTDGWLHWDGVDFRTVLNDLAITHNVDITFNGNISCKCYGQYPATRPVQEVIEQVLQACGKAARVDKKSENRLIVSILP